jgi:hypothetical protein
MLTEKVAQMHHPESIVQFVRAHYWCTGVTCFGERNTRLFHIYVIGQRDNCAAWNQHFAQRALANLEGSGDDRALLNGESGVTYHELT